MPVDADFAYWNAAQPGMQIPWLKGGETVDLTNLGSLTRFVIPRMNVLAHVMFEDGQMRSEDFHIDTLIIDTDAKRIRVSYRFRVPKTPAVDKMDVPAERMEVPTDLDTTTYANADLTDIIKVFEQYGARFLSADEIRAEMPEYPR